MTAVEPGATGRVCVVGSANLDLVAQTSRLPAPGETVLGHGFFEAPGGKGLNQAVAAARAGAEVVFVGAVGDDDAGRALRSVMQAEGLDVRFVETVQPDPTGRALIGVDDAGSNLIIVVPGANARVDASLVAAAADAIADAAVVLVQHEIPDASIAAALAIARRGGAVTILNPAPARPVPPDVLALVDVLVPNEHEWALIEPASVSTLVVTEGERGARVVTADAEWRVPAFAVEAVDTVAAGDAFCGALAAALARGRDLRTALTEASAAGALATTAVGAVPSLPTAPAIAALIARG